MKVKKFLKPLDMQYVIIVFNDIVAELRREDVIEIFGRLEMDNWEFISPTRFSSPLKIYIKKGNNMKYYFDNNLNLYDEMVVDDLLTEGKEIKALGYFSTYKEAEKYFEEQIKENYKIWPEKKQ